MKIIALGANLPSDYGSPAETLQAAVRAIAGRGITVIAASHIWITAPVPFHADHPWYHNGVIAVESELGPHALLAQLLDIEQAFGRVRTVRNAPRLLDLDLIAYDDAIIGDGPDLIVPHPRMHERAFVLMPLSDIADDWTHPQMGVNLKTLLAAVPADQKAERTKDQLL